MQKRLNFLLFTIFWILITNIREGENISLSDLPQAINDIISDPSLSRMEWGIQIASQNYNSNEYSQIYAINENQFFTPASNNKVLSTAAAFLFFGEDYQIQTPIYADSNYSTSINEVCIAGRGDPSFTILQLEEIVNKFLQNGVKGINKITLDDGYFQPPFPQAWEWEDLQADYGAQPTSFILSQNNIEFTVYPSNLSGGKPQINFKHQFDYSCLEINNFASTISSTSSIKTPLSVGYKLGSNAIQLVGEISIGGSPQSFVVNSLMPIDRFKCALENVFNLNNYSPVIEVGNCFSEFSQPPFVKLFDILSPKLVETMNYTLQVSNNLYAECFQRNLGMEMDGLEGDFAHGRGIEGVRTILGGEGVDVSTFQQDDGSGLSRHNLVSPASMVQTFVMMANTQNGDVYRRLLPVAGESGSLANRFVNTTAQGIVQAKTGSMSGVNSLSGYVDQTANFSEIVFSIITNFSNHPSSTVREAIDSIVVLLSQLTN